MPDRERFDRNFLDAVPESRRAFLKKMAAVAFAAPVISSFAMDGVALAGGQYQPNQTYGNQTECRPFQHMPNMTYGNMTFPGPRPGGFFGNFTWPFFRH